MCVCVCNVRGTCWWWIDDMGNSLMHNQVLRAANAVHSRSIHCANLGQRCELLVDAQATLQLCRTFVSRTQKPQTSSAVEWNRIENELLSHKSRTVDKCVYTDASLWSIIIVSSGMGRLDWRHIAHPSTSASAVLTSIHSLATESAITKSTFYFETSLPHNYCPQFLRLSNHTQQSDMWDDTMATINNSERRHWVLAEIVRCSFVLSGSARYADMFFFQKKSHTSWWINEIIHSAGISTSKQQNHENLIGSTGKSIISLIVINKTIL